MAVEAGRGLLIGMVVHLAMSIALGMALAVPVAAIGGWATTAAGGVLAGMALGLIVWLVMQYLGRDRPGGGRTVHPLGVRHRAPDVRLVTGPAIAGARISVGTVRTAR